MLVVFNIGGTGCRVAGSKDGKSVAKIVRAETLKRFPEGLKLLKKMIMEAAEGTTISAIGGGIAGVWDRNKTALLKSPNLPDWESKPIKKKLELEFGVPVILENDAAVEGLGEANAGAGRKYQIVGYVCVGTGIGGRELWRERLTKKPGGLSRDTRLFITRAGWGIGRIWRRGGQLKKSIRQRRKNYPIPKPGNRS